MGAYMELILATNNKGKQQEIRSLLPQTTILTLKDIGFNQEIPEPYHTFRENACTKAKTIYDFCGKPVMADDSGICANALNGAPGVFSARFAGDDASDEENVQKLLQQLENAGTRKAHYTAVICLIINGEAHYFEGNCYGAIIRAPRGKGGFGYDPVFVPDGYGQTFGELPAAIKNGLSHRGAAVQQMVQFLNGFS